VPFLSRMLVRLLVPCAALLAVGATHAQPARLKQKGEFPVVTLTAGMYLIKAEVAANAADREQGLMFRKGLGSNEGMLFVFDESAGHCFWMKNTPLPLSIAFIDDDGVVSDIDEMAPETTNNHCPTRPGRYALEMSQGWFTAKGIRPGTRIGGLPQ
jgi:uncharacterized membrane protein (UPF0127 family)